MLEWSLSLLGNLIYPFPFFVNIRVINSFWIPHQVQYNKTYVILEIFYRGSGDLSSPTRLGIHLFFFYKKKNSSWIPHQVWKWQLGSMLSDTTSVILKVWFLHLSKWIYPLIIHNHSETEVLSYLHWSNPVFNILLSCIHYIYKARNILLKQFKINKIISILKNLINESVNTLFLDFLIRQHITWIDYKFIHRILNISKFCYISIMVKFKDLGIILII
jgi:hypothetical protein